MSDRRSLLSPNFSLAEFLPRGWDGSVPGDVLGNLITLCEELLEPARAWLGQPIRVNDGWRLPAHNAEVGGVKASDHLSGSAADIWAASRPDETWQQATERLFHWMRVSLAGKYGQLILEDHRLSAKRDTALWLHVAIPSAKHPGRDDRNAVLVSFDPGRYNPYEEPRA